MREVSGDPQSPARSPVLLLAHSYPPVSHSGSERPFRFAKYLARLGHRVEVLTSTQFHLAPDEPGIHRVPRAPQTAAGRLWRKGIWMLCAPLRHYDYGMTWIVDSVGAALRLARRMQPCCVLSTFPPLSTHWTALRLKQKLGVKWVADFRDPLVGNPFRPQTRFSQWLDRRIEAAIAQHADAIVANTTHLAEELRRRYPQAASKVSVVWNGYDPEEPFGPLPIPPRDYRVLAHVGTIYGGRHPSMLLDSLERIGAASNGTPPLRLVQVGSIEATSMSNRERFDAWVREGRIQLSGERVPRKEALRTIAEADLLLLLDLNLSGDSTQVPAKIFDYVRAGRPILLYTSRNSPTENILARSGIPHCVVYRDDSQERSDAEVRRFLALPAEPTAPSEWFRENFDGARQAASLHALIERL